MNDFDQTVVINASMSGKRVDSTDITGKQGLSRSRLQSLIRAGNVRVNGFVVKPSAILKAGDVVSYRIPPLIEMTAEAQNIPLKILYEDSDLIVINKPRGMIVHPGAGIHRDTVVNALLYHCGDLSGIAGVVRPGIVHRLDKGTSGVLIAAKHDASHIALSRQFAARTMEKEYLAIVVKSPEWQDITVNAPIARHPAHRVKMAVVSTGKPATTVFRKIAGAEQGSLVKAFPFSGRTHQIRVHLHSLGFPVLGDALYGQGCPKHLPGNLKHILKSLEGFCLHARRLVFRHPSLNQLITVTADIPDDFAIILKILDINLPDLKEI